MSHSVVCTPPNKFRTIFIANVISLVSCMPSCAAARHQHAEFAKDRATSVETEECRRLSLYLTGGTTENDRDDASANRINQKLAAISIAISLAACERIVNLRRSPRRVISLSQQQRWLASARWTTGYQSFNVERARSKLAGSSGNLHGSELDGNLEGRQIRSGEFVESDTPTGMDPRLLQRANRSI